MGYGPVRGYDSALRKALITFYPSLENLKLTDFKVMILSSEKGTGAVTRVLIESSDDSNRHWTTIGVSPNIIDASYNAIYDSITYKLFHDLSSKSEIIKPSIILVKPQLTRKYWISSKSYG